MNTEVKSTTGAARWSRGMVLALGVKGTGFNSQLSSSLILLISPGHSKAVSSEALAALTHAGFL